MPSPMPDASAPSRAATRVVWNSRSGRHITSFREPPSASCERYSSLKAAAMITATLRVTATPGRLWLLPTTSRSLSKSIPVESQWLERADHAQAVSTLAERGGDHAHLQILSLEVPTL